MNQGLFVRAGLLICLVTIIGLGKPRFASAQVQLRLVDVSGKSPIHVSGYIEFSDHPSEVMRYSYQVHASAKNVSNKDVLLMLIHFEANGGSGPGLDDNSQYEYFFGEGLRPNMSEIVSKSPIRFSAPTVNGAPADTNDLVTLRPKAIAQVEFVQFSDGSTWGDVESAKDDVKARRASLKELKALDRIYSESGEQAFREELSKQTALPCINSLQSACKSDADFSRCTLDKVRVMLEAASNHQREMRSRVPIEAEGLR
jgi:hypothetical protein